MKRDIQDADEVVINGKRYVRLEGSLTVDATIDTPMAIRVGDYEWKCAIVFKDAVDVDRDSLGSAMHELFKPGKRVRILLVDRE